MNDRRLLDWLFLFLGFMLMAGAYIWHQTATATAIQAQDSQPKAQLTPLTQQSAPSTPAQNPVGGNDKAGKDHAATEVNAELQTPPPDAPMSVWMEKKLKYSQEIFRLLAVGNLEELQVTARRMRLVSKVEGFIRSNSPVYKNQLSSFELATEELIRQAERRNIEGATLAFHQLTTSCVNCHVTLR